MTDKKNLQNPEKDETRPSRNVIRLDKDNDEFQVEGESFKLTGQSTETGLQILAVKGNARLMVDSDKCDWRISTDIAELQTKLDIEPGNWSIKGKAGGFTGAVSSDKCDWRIRAIEDFVTNPADITLTREGLNNSLNINANLPAMRMMASSSKCDFNFKLNPDWLINPADFSIQGEFELGRVDFNANMPNMSMRGSSSKCDWNIRARGDLVSNPAEILIDKDTQLEQITVRANLPSVRANMSSSKCDWNITTQRGTNE